MTRKLCEHGPRPVKWKVWVYRRSKLAKVKLRKPVKIRPTYPIWDRAREQESKRQAGVRNRQNTGSLKHRQKLGSNLAGKEYKWASMYILLCCRGNGNRCAGGWVSSDQREWHRTWGAVGWREFEQGRKKTHSQGKCETRNWIVTHGGLCFTQLHTAYLHY